MNKDYQTHVFTSTYTADVSGVCSAMYELGGMSVLHDPSGCNSTYTTHDEPRWFDSDSLMFVSGLDEITAVLGDDSVLIRDVVQAVRDLQPRFVTLCGASIPHIIAFDYKGVAHLIEEECGVPVLPVATDGLKSYVSGVDLAFTAWIRRFADPVEHASAMENSVNLIGVTPLDFSVNDNVQRLRRTMENAGLHVNCCMAMGDTFENLTHIYRVKCNVVVSSAGRKTARYMMRQCGIPYVEGLPVGKEQTAAVTGMIRSTLEDGKCRSVEAHSWNSLKTGEETPGGIYGKAGKCAVDIHAEKPGGDTLTGKYECNARTEMRGNDKGNDRILVIGEEIFARSLAEGINLLPDDIRAGKTAYALWPDVDEGLAEDILIEAVRSSHTVIADPLYRVICKAHAPELFIDFPHEAYSGRIFRNTIPVFCGESFDVASLIQQV